MLFKPVEQKNFMMYSKKSITSREWNAEEGKKYQNHLLLMSV